jgi:hypothetical protein
MFTTNMMNFEKQITAMGVKSGMLSVNSQGYISPIVNKLFVAYVNKTLTQTLVNEELAKLN